MHWTRMAACGLLALAVCLGAAAEQRLPGRPHGPSDELARFEAALPKLDLWPEQKPRIQKLLTEVRAQLKKIEQAPGAPEQKGPQFMALRERARKQLDRIITVAQAEKLKQLLNQGGKPRAGGK